MKIDGDTTPLVPITFGILFQNLFGMCYLATSMVVEGANQYGANQYIFLKQLRFIIYMRLGDTVYQP